MKLSKRIFILAAMGMCQIAGCTVFASEGADYELADALKEKYSEAHQYSGNVLKVQRDENIVMELGFNPWISDTSIYDMFAVYKDADLQQQVEIYLDYDAESKMLIIEPPYYGVGEVGSWEVDLSHLQGNFLSEDEGLAWGTLGQYYLAVSVDTETGDALEEPLITMIQVNAEIQEAPRLNFSQTEEGLARFTWQEIEDAQGYLVFLIHKDEQGLWEEAEVFADVKENQWISDMSMVDDMVMDMNSRFQQYYLSDDTLEWMEADGDEMWDEILADDTEYGDYFTDYFGVIAYNSEGCSHMSNLLSGQDLAHMLPMEPADYFNGDDEFYGVTDVADLPAVMGITMCDGTTAQRVLNYDFDKIEIDEENRSFYITGNAEKTAFSQDILVYDINLDTVWEELDKIRIRQENLKNKGGNVEAALAILSGTELGAAAVGEGTQKDVPVSPEKAEDPTVEGSEMAEVSYTANSAMSEYIARYMMDTQEAIDLSMFPEAANYENIVDAYYEARYQNPLILGIRGGSVEPEERILYVEYDFDRTTTREKQQLVSAKVNEIISQIIRDDMTDLEKELAIHEWICENNEYDYGALENAELYGYSTVDEAYYDSFTAYGTLMNGVSVCAGYSAAFKLLADAAGLESIVVTGYLEGSTPHAWNKVKLDESWHIVDSTNNDNEEIRNALLNISDEGASATLMENEKFVVDSELNAYTADSDELEYYHVTEQYFEMDEIPQALAESLTEDGQALLRTEYQLNDAAFKEVAKEAVQLSEMGLRGYYWMGVILLNEK